MKTLMVLALLLVGCGYDDGPDVMVAKSGIWIEPGIPQGPVAMACAVWAPLGLDCTIVSDSDLAMVRVVSDHLPDCAPSDGVTWTGQGGGGEASIRMACWLHGGETSYDTDWMAHVTAHEIGHAVGLGHVSDPAALMFWDGSLNAPLLVDADRAEWARVRRQ